MDTPNPHKFQEDIEFTATTGEFFKIWIVNILLTIITLGFYSPWAKVRTKQYLYSNTLLMDGGFDYLADPIKILKGRIIALVFFGLYSASSIVPTINIIFAILFIFLIPWVVIKAITFNFYNTSYRNIRFNFKGTYGRAFMVFIVLPLFTAITLGLAYPYFIQQQKKFLIDNTRYGTAAFDMHSQLQEFYGIYIRVLLMMFLVFGILTGIAYFMLQSGVKFDPQAISESSIMIILSISVPFMGLIFAYISSKLTNLVLNNTTLNNTYFTCNLETFPIFWLFVVNTIAIIISFGLLIPWAIIRTIRYKTSCITVYPQRDFNDFVAAEAIRSDAIGEEIGDIFDIDLGL